MRKKLFVIIFFYSGILFGQNNRVNKFKIYAGIGYSNITVFTGPVGASFNSLSQTILAIPVNSPNYLWTYQVGITKSINLSNYLNLDIGVKFFQRGRSDFGKIAFPVSGSFPERLSYIGLTSGLSFFPLKSKNISLNTSLSTAYLLYVNKLPGLDQDAFFAQNDLGLELSFGISLPITNRIEVGISFYQSLNIIAKSIIIYPNAELVFPNPDFEFETKAIIHAFELNINYAF